MVGTGHGLIATQVRPLRGVESVNLAHKGVDLVLVGGCGGDEFGLVGCGEGGPLRHADAAEVLRLEAQAVAAHAQGVGGDEGVGQAAPKDGLQGAEIPGRRGEVVEVVVGVMVTEG